MSITTSSDNELFELCKAVHEKTGWKGLGRTYVNKPTEPDKWHPLYTSDYLLEKLPKGIKGDYLNIFSAGIKSWYALYGRTTTAKNTGFYGEADTPLKALLKLVLALHDAKELTT